MLARCIANADEADAAGRSRHHSDCDDSVNLLHAPPGTADSLTDCTADSARSEATNQPSLPVACCFDVAQLHWTHLLSVRHSSWAF